MQASLTAITTLYCCACADPGAGAGLGLWTARPFKRNEYITEYSCKLIDYSKALALAAAGKSSHVIALAFGFQSIKGITTPKLGKGGASFANDARDTKANNAKFVRE
jgi:hypothetical protein